MQFRSWKNQEIKKYLLSIYKIELPHVKHKTKTKVSQLNLEVFFAKIKNINQNWRRPENFWHLLLRKF